MAVYDCKTLCACIPLDDLTDRVHQMIGEVFDERNEAWYRVTVGQPGLWLEAT